MPLHFLGPLQFQLQKFDCIIIGQDSSFAELAPEGWPNLPHGGASSAIMTCSFLMKITLYRTETHDGGYRDWYRPIVPYLNIIGFAGLPRCIVFRKLIVLCTFSKMGPNSAPVSPT